MVLRDKRPPSSMTISMSSDSSRSYDRRSPKWTPSPTAGSRSYYASWKESLRNECLEKARKRREDRANTYRCCGVSPGYSTEREAQSLITETLGHPGTPGQLIGNFVYSTPVQGYSWRNDFYLSDNELFQLMQEVQEELQREESIFNQEVQAAEIQCEQEERYLEEQIAEYEGWQMDNMTERSCCGLNIKDEECSVLCPICRKGNLFLNDNEIITCRESFCACRITHGSLPTLRQCLDNLYSQHIVTCPYGSLIFDIQRHGQSDVLCAHCHQCHLDTIIL